MFLPYQNEHQSMQIGDLVIENQLDKVIVYGDIDIHKNHAGLEQAKRLQALFNDVVAQLQTADLDAVQEKVSVKTVTNPFSK